MTESLKCPLHGAEAFPFPRDPARPLDPAPELMRRLRDEPVSKITLWNGKQAWLVTRVEDVRHVMSSPSFSVATNHENTPSVSAAVEARKNLDTSFQRKDAPEHTRHRRMWQPFFSGVNVDALRPAIQRYAEQAVGHLLAHNPPADLVEHVATPIPTRVILELLAIPEGDRDHLQRQSAVLADSRMPIETVTATANELYAYWRGLVKERIARPGDDFVSQLIVREVRDGSLTESEFVSAVLLIQFAGQHTTANSISLGTLTLLQHPDLITKMKADPFITPWVVEELLRFLTIVHNGSARVALKDVDIAGQSIRAGEGVIAHLSTANRDEAAFANGERIDPERHSKMHVAFGAGPHACIGAPLARAELQIVFDTLFRRIPTLRLTVDPVSASYKGDGLFYGLHSLPVAW